MELRLGRLNRNTKLLVLLIALVLAGTAIVATQFIRLQATYTFSINTRGASVQLVGSDGSPTGAGFVLTNNSGQYALTLGSWAKGTTKTYTAAFAIVNNENTKLRITAINVAGTGNTSMAVWVHENESKPSDPGAAPSVGVTPQEIGTANNRSCDATDATLQYYNGPWTNNKQANHNATGWVLENATTGDGYTGSPPTTLTYHYAAPYATNKDTATYTGGASGIWVDTNGTGETIDTKRRMSCGTTSYTNIQSNIAWVEMDIIIAANAVFGTQSGSIEIFLRACAGVAPC